MIRHSERPRRHTTLRTYINLALATLGVSFLAACSPISASETPVLPIITEPTPTPQNVPAFFQSYGPEWAIPIIEPVLSNDGISCEEASQLPPEKAGYVQQACTTIDKMIRLFEIDPQSEEGLFLTQAVRGIHFLDPEKVREICGEEANACSIPGGNTIVIDTTLPARPDKEQFESTIVQELIHSAIQNNGDNETYTSPENISITSCGGRVTLTDSKGNRVGINEGPAIIGATMFDYMSDGIINPNNIPYVAEEKLQVITDQAKDIVHQNITHPTETDLSLIVNPTKGLAAYIELFSNDTVTGSPMEQFQNFTLLFPAEAPGCR